MAWRVRAAAAVHFSSNGHVQIGIVNGSDAITTQRVFCFVRVDDVGVDARERGDTSRDNKQ